MSIIEPNWVTSVRNGSDGYDQFAFKQNPKSLAPLVKNILEAQKNPRNYPWFNELKGKIHVLAEDSDKLYNGSLLGVLRKVGSIIKNLIIYQKFDTTAQILLKITSPEPVTVSNDALMSAIKTASKDASDFMKAFLGKITFTTEKRDDSTFILSTAHAYVGEVQLKNKKKTIEIPKVKITLTISKNKKIKLQFDPNIKLLGHSVSNLSIPQTKTEKISSKIGPLTVSPLTLEDAQGYFENITWKKSS